jgi:hypothetical protein
LPQRREQRPVPELFVSLILQMGTNRIFHFLQHRQRMLGAFLVILGLTAFIEFSMGRLPLGPDGRFGWWEGSIWSVESSQRLLDPYSFSHIVHGMLFYALLHLVARRLPLQIRFLTAVLLEGAWEIAENSPFIIDRYREATIALGYVGDSILNSCSDVLMMALGFWCALLLPVWTTISVALVMEVGCALWVRDNLTLNILMLIHPIDAIKVWQSGGRPTP